MTLHPSKERSISEAMIEAYGGHGTTSDFLTLHGRSPAEIAIAALEANGFAVVPKDQVLAWQPIETAPQGRYILVWGERFTSPKDAIWNRKFGAYAENLGLDCAVYPDATHWMPLPPSPKVTI